MGLCGNFTLAFLNSLLSCNLVWWMTELFLNLNCVMPRSSKPPDTCKWGGPKWQGILQLIQHFFSRLCFFISVTDKFIEFFFKLEIENSAKLQITLPFIYMSLNKNNVYCVRPRSSKPLDTCKWARGGPKWQGILQLLRKLLKSVANGTGEYQKENRNLELLSILISLQILFFLLCRNKRKKKPWALQWTKHLSFDIIPYCLLSLLFRRSVCIMQEEFTPKSASREIFGWQIC